MTSKLAFRAVSRYLLGVLLVGILIFLPAGTLDYLYGWILMAVLFIPMFFAGIVLMIKNPNLLVERLDVKEKRSKQNTVIKLSGLMFLAGFIVAGLGIRLDWYILPLWVVVIASLIFVISYGLYAEVLRENTYLSRTIKVQENQKVIDTGLYGIVRHPMYSVTLLLFLSMPLILGSVFAFLIFLAYPFIIARRIRDEEELLEKELDGYIEYKSRVKYRLIPFVW